MAKKLDGRRALREWKELAGISFRELGDRVGDAYGNSTKKYAVGMRELPLSLATRISQVTGIPLAALLSSEQRRTAELVVKLIARDAA